MNRRIIIFLTLMMSNFTALVQAQIDARLFHHPDVSATRITFAYADDIWVVEKSGGLAHHLSSPAGTELMPRFSPDGKNIAFTANYNGNNDVYIIPSLGGVPEQKTWHGHTDWVIDWHPEGKNVLFATSRESGRQRYKQFFLTGENNGLPGKLPLAHAEFGSFSPDGKYIAFTDKSRVNRTWKRYRGGMAPDIWIFNLEDHSAENITSSPANDELPMWHEDKIYYMSDKGPGNRFNIWVYDLNTKQHQQVTEFSDADIHFPSIGPEDIVFEANGKLYLLNLTTMDYNPVDIQVVSDKKSIMPKTKNVEKYIQHAWISPGGERAIIETRGELFSVPAEHGYIKNLTQTPGTAERFPSWSPNGKKIAYWSDSTGEYELTVLETETGKAKTLTSYGAGYRYKLYWSPDSKKIAFADQTMNIYMYDTETRSTNKVDKGLWMSHGPLENFSVSWSPDSKWMAYSRGMKNRNHAVFIYNAEDQQLRQVTSAFYSDGLPVFDPEGKYLFILTSRHMNPLYSDFDNDFIYTGSTQLAAIPLTKEISSPVEPRNDDVTAEDEKEEYENDKKKNNKKKDKGKDDNEEKEEVKITIDFEGLEKRIELLPVEPGNYNNLQAAKGKVIFRSVPETGPGESPTPVKYYDLEEREEKTLIDDADFILVTANGEKALVGKKNNMAVIEIKPDQKMEKMLRLKEMEMTVDPKEEWKQIFNDAWRLERDYFYDKNMHGVNWEAVRQHYSVLLDMAITRFDVNYVLGEMIAELSASHTYRWGGDAENANRMNVGYLGIDWEIDNGYYRIKKFIEGASWDAEVYSPLQAPGLNIEAGSYILAVNGNILDINKEPYAAFQGLADKTVELLINDKPSKEGARKVVVKTLGNENRLRHLSWIEHNRKIVDDSTGGSAGYIYVRSTGIDGQNELMRQFAAQWDKEALIIDERFNSGGQIPDRFIELLNRPPLAYWAVRDGKDWQWPPIAHFGPKVMLINGWSGSGGDAFPDFFRKTGLGPLIGSRTWGGLIGMSGVPQLIDGGMVTVPTFRMYNQDGKWFREGYGVKPDIDVYEDPSRLAKGYDPQLEKAIEVIKEKLESDPYIPPEKPAYEKR